MTAESPEHDPKLRPVSALFPDCYPSRLISFPTDTRALRLLGSNWAFCILGNAEPVSKGSHFRLEAKQFFGKNFGSSSDPKIDFYQNVFALEVHDGASRYPVLHRRAIGASTELLIQKLAERFNYDIVQLTQGRIEVPEYSDSGNRRLLLDDMRTKLRLGRPAKDHRSIYLYPDGFCIYGSIAVPWMETAIDGWFKLTTRGAAVPGAPTDDTQGGLTLCLDPALPSDPEALRQWQQVTAVLNDLIDQKVSAARWLSLHRTGPISPSSFFWPGRYDKKVFFKRVDDRVQLESASLRVRLTPGRSDQQDIAGIDVTSLLLQIEKTENRLSLTAGAEPAKSQIRYRFKAAQGVTKAVEELKLGGEDSADLELAVPLIETAQMLRAESGMPDREPELGDDPVGAIWTFTPIDTGLLHWPFPDATPEGLETILEAHKVTVPSDPIASVPGNPVTGAMLLGNEPDLAGFNPKHRGWRLAVTEGEGGWFRLDFGRGRREPSWKLTEASVAVGRCMVSLEGAVPVIPFRQTAERLLPDHDERALRGRSLRAVSPRMLRGLEARMWKWAESPLATPKTRSVQAKLVVSGFKLVAPGSSDESTRMAGRVHLFCTIRSRSKKSDKVEFAPDPSLRPWLWTRFGALPTVQTMPLAVSGGAALHPSGTRELHPLVRDRASAELQYTFENALEMGLPAPRLVVKSGGRYVTPTGGDRTTEVGMAALTLPSLTIFPGSADSGDPVRLPQPNGWTWPLGNGKTAGGKDSDTSPCQVELRHDLAWCDERYATAQTASADGESASPRGLFTPCRGNGPQDEDGTSYGPAWAQADRLAALAASDSRALVRRETKDGRESHVLIGYRGSGSPGIEIRSISFSSLLDIEGERLRTAGGVTLDLAGADPSEIALEGLPARADLVGYSGRLAGDAYDHGTLSAKREEGDVFTDQRSLASGLLQADDDFRTLEVGGATLYSLPSPLTAASAVPDGREICFWVANAPSSPADSSPGQWRDFESDHVEGLRWSLEEPDGPLKGFIHWRNGIYFEPLRLTACAPGRLTFTGRLGIAIIRKDPTTGKGETRGFPEFVPQLWHLDEKLSSLVLSKQGGKWSWKIEAADGARLRLERSGAQGAPAALLAIGKDLKTATLHFDLFGRPARAELEADPRSEKVLRFKLKASVAAGAGPIHLSRAKVMFARRGPLIGLAWSYLLLAEDPGSKCRLEATGLLPHPHYSAKCAVPTAELAFSGQGGSIRWSGSVGHWRFNEKLLAIDWGPDPSQEGGRQAQKSWIGLLPDEGCSGAVLAVLRETGAADFSHVRFRIDGEARLGTLRLQLNGKPDSVKAALHGSLEVTSAVSGAGLEHDAEMRFDGSPVPTPAANARIAAHVRHKLVHDRSVELMTVQHVVFEAGAQGKGAVDFATSFIAQGDGEKALLVILPGRQSFPPSPPGGPPAALSCHILPPVSAAAASTARLALAAALDAGSEGLEGWAARLLVLAGEPHAAATAGPPGDLSELFRLTESGRPLIYSLALPAGWTIPADETDYAHYLRELSKQLNRLLLAVPSGFLADPSRSGYQLYGPDVHGDRVIDLARGASITVVDGGEVEALFSRWSERLLASTAPWAAAAVLVRYPADGPMLFRVVPRDEIGEGDPLVPGNPWDGDVEPWADPRRTDLPGIGAGLAMAYVPSEVRAVDLSYSGSSESELNVSEPVLAAHALQRRWQLSAQEADSSGNYSATRDFRLAIRQRVSFRPAVAWTPGARLTPMLTNGAARAAAGGLMPATRLPGHAPVKVDELRQYFAPVDFIVRDISPRPGVWHVRRLGLASYDADAIVSGGPVAAPELPFHARTPRPPITGRNDRPVASEFEQGAFSASRQPQFVLYEARAQPPQAPGPPQAVSRVPRCEAAWLGTVDLPEAGLIDRSWDGVITIRISPLSPALGNSPGGVWRLHSAQVLIDGRAMPLKAAPAADLPKGASQAFVLTSDRSPSEPASGESSFADYVAGLRLSTRARIECEFELVTMPGLRRFAVVELLVAPTAGAGVERPFHLRFEDPAYNDRLVLPVKFAATTDKAQLCADRENVRPDDRLTVAWRRLAGESPAPATFHLQVKRTRSGLDGKVIETTHDIEEKPRDGTSEISRPADQAWQTINCSRLVEMGTRAGFRLEPGDLFSVSTAPFNSEPGAPVLTFDVTSVPLFPNNPAALALLRLDRDGRSLSAPLYVQSPVPTNVDLIDPRDLFSGVARFRAMYHWIHFTPPNGSGPKLYYLQKIAGDGGTYLPEDLGEWLDPPAGARLVRTVEEEVALTAPTQPAAR